MTRIGFHTRLFHLSFDLGVHFPYPYQFDMGANSAVGNQLYLNILMHTILSPVTLCHKFVAEEWKQLFVFMDILYGDALKFWLAKYDCLSEEEIGLCYFKNGDFT